MRETNRDTDALSVIIDDRERAGGLIEALRERLRAEITVERLEVGDVVIRKRYVIERKSASDFVASIVDGRLFEQARQLRAQRMEPVIIIEGEFDREGVGVSGDALRGVMISLELDWRIPVLRSKSVEDTANWIVALTKREAKGQSRPDWRRVSPTGQRIQPPPRRPRRAPVSPEQAKRKRDMELLLSIEGVGRTRAEALMERFGDFASISQASIFELAEVEGVGRRVAEIIWRTFNGDRTPPKRN